MEHYRPNGKMAYGWFCSQCGKSGVNMMGTGHGGDACNSNPSLVQQLKAANPPAGKKPHFVLQLPVANLGL